MLDLYSELRRVVEALDTAGIPHALVGGLAVSIYTTARATEDIDLPIAPANLQRAAIALSALGFRLAGQPMSAAGGRLSIQRLNKIEGAGLAGAILPGGGIGRGARRELVGLGPGAGQPLPTSACRAGATAARRR
jgi:hypothetical protein